MSFVLVDYTDCLKLSAILTGRLKELELKEMWPSLVMVHGKPRHPQSQGSVERANGDIKDMLVAWMGDNKTNDWTIGLKFVQF